MITVSLRKLQFFAAHGVYPEEQKTGNRFEVNLHAVFDEAGTKIDELSMTVNYVRLYDIVRAKMSKPYGLLEQMAMEIGEEIHRDFTQVKKIDIEIVKLHPPIINFIGNVAVRYEKEFDRATGGSGIL